MWKVKSKIDKLYYAMKIMSKVKIIKKNSIKNVLNEKNLLSKLKNPFLVNMVESFQDKDNLYLIMDLLLGGDLRYHINQRKEFKEKELKFIMSCTILGLDYLHKNNIIHKDIKPENLVFDSKGYLRITDLGISKIYHEDNGKENSGTPGYMAPEVLLNENHGFSVDFFALGVIGYEIIMGKRPYIGKDKKEIKKDIVSRQAQIKEDNVPEEWSENSIDFINGLIQRKADKRLGNRDIMELKNHPWFGSLIWDDLKNQIIDAPFKPPEEGNYYHNLEENENIGEETELCYEEIRKRQEYSKYFEDYTFNEINLNANINNNEKIENENENINNNGFGSDNNNSDNLKMKYDITEKIVNKLKDEIKRLSSIAKSININKNKNYKNRNNFIIKNKSNYFNNKEKENQPKLKKLNSLKFKKSYLLYNIKEDKDIIIKSKIHPLSNSPIENQNINKSLFLNNLLSNINKDKRYNKYRYIDKKNDSYSNNYYKSIYAERSYLLNPIFNKKDIFNFNSTNNFMGYNSKKLEQSKLPIIKLLKKSSSMENLDKKRNIKKNEYIISKDNRQYKNDMSLYYTKYLDKK